MTTTGSASHTLSTSSGQARPPRTRVQVEPGVWQHEYGHPVPGLNTDGGPTLSALLGTAWKTQGTCASIDPGPWFAEPATLKSHDAAGICEDCPVRRMCLAVGLAFSEEFGVWGGLSSLERRPLLQRLTAGESLGGVLSDALHDDATQAA